MRLLRLAFLLAAQVFSCAVCALDSLTETQIKAAYIGKFAAYVEWPPLTFTEASTPITIGVLGAREIAEELYYLTKERTVNDRVVQVKSLNMGDSLAGVQILFVGQQDQARLKRLLDSLQVLPILTVTSSPALYPGSVINFITVENHIRFEVSVAQAERNGLKISARLLSVAQKIDAGSK